MRSDLKIGFEEEDFASLKQDVCAAPDDWSGMFPFPLNDFTIDKKKEKTILRSTRPFL